MTLPNPLLTVLAIVAAALSLAALGLVLAPGALRQRRGRGRSALPPDRAMQVLLETQAKSIERLENAVRQLAGGERRLGELVAGSVRNVAVVRFDAFEDMGGRLSFSAALLDGNGDGVVITSINGRQDTRCYAKQIQGGSSIHNLSDEERQAIREALGPTRQIVEAS